MVLLTRPMRQLNALVTSIALLCVLILPGDSTFSQAFDPFATEQKKDETPWPPNDRVKIPQWNFVNVFAGVTDARTIDTGANGAAVKAIKQKFAAAGDGKNLSAMGELFKDHPFEVVEKIAKEKHLTDVEADGLARMRRMMINEAMAKAIAAVDPDRLLTIGMLDSGNKNSGIASDVDQTVFVMPKDAARKLGIDENKVIAEFDAQFKKTFGVPPSRLGIESLNGADFFPDWRQAHSTDKVGTGAHEIGKQATAFMEEADRVVGEKRKNPEAYRSEGQLKSQAEGRGYEALQEHHQRVRDLVEAKDRIESIEKNPELDDAKRKGQIAGIEAELLKKYNKNYPAGSMAELEAKFHKDSPWTEVGWDEKGNLATDQLADPKDKVLANKPEFHKRFAFDGAWDNWIMYEHHPHNRRKYLLRSIAEGVGLKRQLGGQPLSTFEYEKVYAKGGMAAHAELKAFIDDVYRDLPDATREQFKKALDVAAKERLRHKGVKNPSTGQDYTLREVWSEHWPAVTEAERAMYRDLPPEAFEKMLHERAIRQWEQVGREIMIENLLRTVDEPAKMLRSPLSNAEFDRIRQKFPDATRAKLSKAVQRQLYHGIHDLISIEHARELVASPEQRKNLPKRQPDLVDRLLKQLGGEHSELGRQVREVAVAAACKRIAIEPGDRTFRQEVYDYMRTGLKERLAAAQGELKDIHQRAKATYDDFKAGKITPEVVTRHLMIGAAERVVSAKLYGKHLLGYDVRNANLLIPDRGWPRFEVEYGPEKWSGQKLLSHVASPGNVDSALTVMLAYQEGGGEAAAWAAGYEMMMNVPIISKANAVKELVVHGRPQGVVMLGSAMMVPVLGQAFIVINIGKTSVMLLGNYVLEPLKDDDADKMYQGFLDERSGFKGVQQSQRPSLLHFVPIRVIQRETENAKGEKVPGFVWRAYSREEADKLFNVLDDKQYRKLLEAGVLGGGADWDAALAEVHDEIRAPREHFEAKRASMYLHFRDAVGARLAKDNLDPHEDEAFPVIVEFFMGYIDDWVNAKGAFADFGENLLISRRFEDEAIRRRIAHRAAGDFVRSYNMIRGTVIDTGSIERNIEARIDQLKFEEIAGDANFMIYALEKAIEMESDPELAYALRQELDRRREEARERAPRFHARPRLVMASGRSSISTTDDKEHQIEFLISVLDGPEPGELKPANDSYKTTVRYELEVAGPNEMLVTAYVQVVGAQTGERIPPYAPKEFDNYSITDKGELAIKLGKIARSASMPQSTDVKVRYRLSEGERPPAGAAVRPTPTAAAPAPVSKPEVTTDDKGIFLFEDWNAKKATPRPQSWGGRAVVSLAGELWICWEKAPLGRFYYYDMSVTGGVQNYDKPYAGYAHVSDHFPDQAEPSGRPNVFILPFDWPEGHVGTFRLKGSISAFDKAYQDDTWKQATPVEKFSFDETFAIADERDNDGVDLAFHVEERIPVDQVTSIPGLTAAQHQQLAKYPYEGKVRVIRSHPFDEEKVSMWHQKWGDSDVFHRPRLQVRWKDVPAEARFYYTMTIKGGHPRYDDTRSESISPYDDFPPAPSKQGKGSSAFVLDVNWPLYRAGTFDIEGTIIALPVKPTAPKWQDEKPLATFPFKEQFTLRNRARTATGTYFVGNGPSASVSILVSYVQSGKRPIRISCGGATQYAFLDRNHYSGGFFTERKGPSLMVGMTMPNGMAPAESATVTFMDFGETVTLEAKLKPQSNMDYSAEKARAVQYISTDSEPRLLKDIESAKRNAENPDLNAIYRAYADLAGAYGNSDPAKAMNYAKLAMEYEEKYHQRALEHARRDSDKESARLGLGRAGERVYNLALASGQWGEAQGLFQQMIGKMQGTGLDSGTLNRFLHGMYDNHARYIFQYTGDTNAATAMWRQAEEAKKGATNMITFGGGGGEPVSPFEVDEAFR